MERTADAPSRLQLIHREAAVPATAGRNCEALLNVLNGRVQLLIDHIQVLEERILQIEDVLLVTDAPGSANTVITAGSIRIDHGARRVFVGESEIPLSPIEYRLIYHLAVNSGKVVLHRDLLRRALSHGEVNRANLKVYIGRLRAKLNSGTGARCELRAIRGVGYRLSA